MVVSPVLVDHRTSRVSHSKRQQKKRSYAHVVGGRRKSVMMLGLAVGQCRTGSLEGWSKRLLARTKVVRSVSPGLGSERALGGVRKWKSTVRVDLRDMRDRGRVLHNVCSVCKHVHVLYTLYACGDSVSFQRHV